MQRQIDHHFIRNQYHTSFISNNKNSNKYSYLQRSPQDQKLKKRYLDKYHQHQQQQIKNNIKDSFNNNKQFTLNHTFNTQFSPYRPSKQYHQYLTSHPSQQLICQSINYINKDPILIMQSKQQCRNTEKKLLEYQNQNHLIKQKLFIEQIQSLKRQLIRKQEQHYRSINQVRQQIQAVLMKNMLLEKQLSELHIRQQFRNKTQKQDLLKQFAVRLQQKDAQTYQNNQKIYIQRQFIKKIRQMKYKMQKQRGINVNQMESLKQIWRWIKNLGYSLSYLQNWVKIIAQHYKLQGSTLQELTTQIQALLP